MQLSVSNNCKSRDCFKPKYKNLYPCCFNFYKTCLISVINFCTSCKVFFASLPDFHLKKVVIAKKNMPVTTDNKMEPIFIEKANDFCEYIQLLFDDEPILIKFEITTAFIKFAIYCNHGTFDDFNEVIEEMDAELHTYNLIEEGMSKFYFRLEVFENIKYDFCWVFISLIINLLDFAKNLVQ